MSATSVFPPRLLAGGIAAAALIFALSLYLMTRVVAPEDASAVGPNSFSTAATGYAGIAEILKELGETVVKSDRASTGKLGRRGVLIVAEPDWDQVTSGSIRKLLDADSVLLILPKWLGQASLTQPGWLGEAKPAPPVMAETLLGLAAPKAELRRQATLPIWTTNRLGILPDPDTPVQLIRSDGLTPVVGSADGMLVGERKENGHRLWILADPDVIANHGLARIANARFAVALIDALHGQHGAVVFDETIHGFEARQDTNRLLLPFRRPFVFATVQGLLTLALLLWGSVFRFGPPQPLEAALVAGKAGLVRNAAALLGFAGHQPVLVRRYVQATLGDLALRLHAPPGLSDTALADWLDRIATARGVEPRGRQLQDTVARLSAQGRPDLPALVAAARAIHRWKQEILNGVARPSRGY